MWIDLNRLIQEDSATIGNIEEIFFPMGEMHIRVPDSHPEICNVIARLRNEADVMRLLLTINAIKNQDHDLHKLIIPYLPYSRQDRVAVRGDSFSLKVIADILDRLGFREIITVDVHSNVASLLFKKTRFTNYIPIREVGKWIENLKIPPSSITLIAPDLGASKRTWDYMPLGFANFVQCLKVRDSSSGKLGGFRVLDTINTKYALVLDDICDGGGTFLGLAPELKKAGAENLLLWTTHGGYTKGFSELLDVYDFVGCTNSYRVLDETVTNNKQIDQISINFKKI